ncbi:DNA internalization-related competence protein ComEC/Rec2 [Bacillus sp. FJAT-27445]|uniref:DNA internalization-related competence protein ComEC/Rec2 n=1 Tax=Bacillus sp. FJAT-27445 TaxID=1679166 RepID=UPI00074337D9|nr:DNA internalization-related competence protein ComEC/Rec2 [Bacillus sp. FJAT-27445]
MKGKIILLAPAALFGNLAAFFHPTPIILFLLLYLVFLIKVKRLTVMDVVLVLTIFVVFSKSAGYAAQANHTFLQGNEKELVLDFLSGSKIDGDVFRSEAVEVRSGERIVVAYKIKDEKEKYVLEEASFFGKRCSLAGILEVPPGARNPGSFDYKSYLSKHEAYWLFKLDQPPITACDVRHSGFVERLGKIRNEGIKGITARFPDETASIAAALLFGDQTLFTEEVNGAYKRLGITHLLAISGMQVTLLAGMALYLGIRLGITRERMTVLLLIGLPLYAVLAGASPSVVRSVLMAGILLLANTRPSAFPITTVDALSLSFLAYLFFNPYVLFDPGFQLSYSVTFALLLSGKAILKKNWGSLGVLLTGTMISQLAALPILLFHFYGVPLISVAANLIYIPLYSFFLMPAVYFLYPLSLLGNLARPASLLVNQGVILTDRLAIFLAKTPVQLNPGHMDMEAIMFYTAIVLISLLFWERALDWKKAAICLSLPFVLLTSQIGVTAFLPHHGEITIIDVGQGDSILISLPDHKGVYLIDSGGAIDFAKKDWQRRRKTFEPGRDTVIPFLKAKGIAKVDKLILTHGDIDHIGGAMAILEEIKVGEILIPKNQEKSLEEERIIGMAKEKRIPIQEISRGDYWKAGSYSFHVLSPGEGYKGDRNGGSVAIYTLLGGKGWFFTGDLDEEGEKEIVEHYPDLKIDVLKAGHHGSRTSSSTFFLEAYRPGFALISAGVNNRFGHPHTDTLLRFGGIDAKIYRTDLHGAITYTFREHSGTFSTYLPYTGASGK